MPLMQTLRVVVLSLVLFFSPFSQAKEMRALLVGVSEYPNLPQKLQLKGPRNDVVRAREVLMLRGFAQDNITLLADGVSGAALPTRRNILSALDRLAQTAHKDDLVFLYFAGHGSQQPADLQTAAGRAEPDGLYEIFLPRDVGKWSGSVGSVQNALVKTELRDVVDRILAKGAFVWGVFDACHAATLVRGENDGVHYRYVNPQQLGVPPAVLNVANPAADKTPFIASTLNEQAANSVFFYATQTREAAPEMILPQGQNDGRTFGLFSFTVMQALETGVPMSYRQMAQSILTRYGAMNETRVTPLFSGTALDQPVLFQDAPPVQQWKIERGSEIVVLAGALSRLNEGTILAVMPNPLAKNDEAIGYLKLTQVGLTTSSALPAEFNNRPALKTEAIPPGSFARVVHSPPQYTLRVSVDATACGKRCASKSVVDELRKTATSVPGTSIKWLEHPARGEVLLKQLPDRILLLPPSMMGVDCAESAGACEQNAALIYAPQQHTNKSELRAKLSASIHAVARTLNLLRIASNLSQAIANASQLEVTLNVVKKNGTEFPFTQDLVPNLKSGDRINVTLRNNGVSAVDVTLLYVDARYGINVLYPNGPGASNRLEARDSTRFGIAIDDETSGLERILTIAVLAAKTQERADFSFLAQSPLEVKQHSTRMFNDPDVMAFMDAGYASYQTRADHAAPKAPGSRTTMQVFTLNVSR